MRQRRCAALAVSGVLVASSCAGVPARVDPGGRPVPVERRFLRDEDGRALVLQGINVSARAKSPPYLPVDIDPDGMVELRRRLGFNHVRLLLQWRAVEPEPGRYDDTYLDAVAERIRWAHAAGLYVILDMHQDLWGDWDPDVDGEGNGAPAWATRTDGASRIPLPDGSPWWLNAIQPPVMAAFDSFWRDTDLQDAYADMWAHVASRLGSEPGVLGYDLMNEPYPGSDPAGFEAGRLAPMYRRTIAAIRAVDTERWIFLEPMSFGINQGLASGMPPIDDPRPGEDRLAWYPHFYPEGDLDDGVWDGRVAQFDLWRLHRVLEADRLGMPVLAGEFGLSGRVVGAEAYLRRFIADVEDIGSGWSYWSYDRAGPGGWSPLRRDGSLEPRIAAALVRPFPMATAGDPVEYGFDPATRTLRVTFRSRPGLTAATLLSIPDLVYPGGWQLEVDGPAGRWSAEWDDSEQVLGVRTDPAVGSWTIRVVPARPSGADDRAGS